MNICLMNTAVSWGGGEKWHLEMSLELSKRGHQLFLITNHNSILSVKAGECEINSYTLQITNFSFINPLKIYQLYRYFKKNKIHSIILNLPNDLKAGGVAASLACVKTIIYRRGSAIPVSNSFSNRLLFKKVVTGIIANSFETKNTILQNNHKLIQPEKIRVIYNGLKFPEVCSREITVNEKIIFGNMGRLVKQKGQDILIDIVNHLKEKLNNFKLIIAGEGPLESSLIKLAMDKNVAEYVEFRGFVDDVWDFMQTIDVFLFPSRWEGFGYVVVEAMACGKPVIAFDVSSNPELIRSGFNGYLIEPGDINEFANKAYLLATNITLIKHLGMNGKTFAEQNFRLSKKVDEVENFLAS